MTEIDKKELAQGYVNLRDHFELLWLEREKLLDYKFKAAQHALTLASETLKDHLHQLNNAHQRAAEDREDFVKKDVYNEKTKAYDVWCSSVDKKIAYWSAAIVVLVFVIELVVKLTR